MPSFKIPVRRIVVYDSVYEFSGVDHEEEARKLVQWLLDAYLWGDLFDDDGAYVSESSFVKPKETDVSHDETPGQGQAVPPAQ